MSNRNEFSAGLGAKICGAVADIGGTPEELNLLSEKPDVLRQAFALLRGTATIVIAKILELVKSEIKIPSLKKAFVAKDFFKVDTSHAAKVKISFVWDRFQELFSNLEVAPRDGYTVSSRKLLKSSVDQPILTELGLVYETDLGAVRSLMEAQPNGEEGELLTNGYANIFYIRDMNGVLRAVGVYWDDGGWRVYANSVDYPGAWDAGSRVFSRNS